MKDFLKTINDVKNGLSVVHNSVDNISKGSQPTSPTSQLDQSSLEKLLIVNMEIKQEFANVSFVITTITVKYEVEECSRII